MELTIDQKDALTELINIGYGRAAGALSELTGYRISLEVPQVTMHEIEAIGPLLGQVVEQDVTSVNQLFSGPISGNALLILDQRAALILCDLLTDDRANPQEMNSSAREVIIEVGNILLNACLGVFGNLLQVHLTFAVPRLHVETVEHLMRAVADQVEEQLRYGLMIHTRFYVKARDITGYMVIVLGVTSLDRLLHEVDRWENGQLA